MNNAVYTLQSGQSLNSSKFCRYLGRKIEKYENSSGIKADYSKIYCLDDAAIDIIYGLMNNKQAKLPKTAFVFCLKKELELYAKLKKLKFKFIEYKGQKKEIMSMLDILERQHMEIKYSIVRAFMQTMGI